MQIHISLWQFYLTIFEGVILLFQVFENSRTFLMGLQDIIFKM